MDWLEPILNPEPGMMHHVQLGAIRVAVLKEGDVLQKVEWGTDKVTIIIQRADGAVTVEECDYPK